MKITTKKGFDFFEASSSFQKAIRRGDSETALYFMVEFFNSGYDEYVWKRIKIITSEDVGLAEPTMPATIHALYQFYSEIKKEAKENRPERMFLTHAVLALLKAAKSRMVDYKIIRIWRDHDENNMQIPDYAYDMHNYKGKQMKRGLDHFYGEGCILMNHKPEPGEDEAKKEALEWHRKFPGKIKFEKQTRGNKTEQFAMFGEEE